MGMDLNILVAKLNTLDYYPELFNQAFGSEAINTQRISRALSQFVRSMISFNSKFDEGMANLQPGQNIGNTPFSNFTGLENLGKVLFFSPQTNCATCHGTTNFTAPGARNNGLDLVYEDNGLGLVTGNPQDNGLFKVNSLRNVAATAPYMHDGRFATLAEVIEHYNSGVQPHPNLSPTLRVGPPQGPNVMPRQLNLTQMQKEALVAFLETLSDEVMAEDEKFSDPFSE
jgi:cytochrome c peroxidase